MLEHAHDLIGFVFAQKTVIDENAGQIVAHGAMDERRRNGAVHAAAESAEHFFVAYALFKLFDLARNEVVHRPIAVNADDIVEEVAQHGNALIGVHHFGMILHAVNARVVVAESGYLASVRISESFEALGQLFHLIGVAHPANAAAAKPLIDGRGKIVSRLLPAVFALIGMHDLAAERMGDELAAVTDAEHGNARLQKRLVDMRRALFVDAGRSAREDYALGGFGEYLLGGRGAGIHFAIDILLPYSARDQLVILTAEVEYDN